MDLVAAARHGDEPEDDRYAAKQRLESAALDLARQVQVTKSQEKELSVVGLLSATHQVLVEIRDSLRRLEGRVAAVEDAVEAGGTFVLDPMDISSGGELEEESEGESEGEIEETLLVDLCGLEDGVEESSNSLID